VIEVYLSDLDCDNFSEPDRWARECCAGYQGVTIVDTSDVYVADEVATYMFNNSADAAWFTLTWKAAK
jgi:hypothetical protein